MSPGTIHVTLQCLSYPSIFRVSCICYFSSFSRLLYLIFFSFLYFTWLMSLNSLANNFPIVHLLSFESSSLANKRYTTAANITCGGCACLCLIKFSCHKDL